MEPDCLRALLVEDDEDDYVLTRDLLSQIGRPVQLDWVADYRQALEQVSRAEHDVYLLDCNLGEHTGLELLREAMAQGSRAPFILLTGQQSYSVDLEAMHAGAADFLVKGQFSPALLERAIRYALERRQSREALEKAHAELEARVGDRTAALAAANDELKREIAERARAEVGIKEIGEALQKANGTLSQKVLELELRNREITLLRDMSELLQTCPSVGDVGMVVAQGAQQLFPEASGALGVLSASRKVVELVASWGESPVDAGEPVFSPEDCWALRCCRPHLMARSRSELVCPHFARSRPRASLCIPMLAHGEALGVLLLMRRDAGEEGIGAARQELAQTVTGSAALALSNLRLRETLRSQSIRDPLTGLFNRRWLEDTLEKEIRRAARRKGTVALLMADVDHFKGFNDRFGHDAGDTVLCTLSGMFSQLTRAGDSVCRYGGEEFTVIMPETPLQVARTRAEAMRERARSLRVFHRDQALGEVTLSLGVASFPEHGVSAEALLRCADGALYRAKSAGRDRVEVGEPPEPAERAAI